MNELHQFVKLEAIFQGSIGKLVCATDETKLWISLSVKQSKNPCSAQISLVVFMSNITTNHAITYTNPVLNMWQFTHSFWNIFSFNSNIAFQHVTTVIQNRTSSYCNKFK